MKWNSDYLLRCIADEYVLIPVAGDAAKSSEIIALNETAGEICALICAGKSEKELIEALLEEYDCSREEIEEDLAATLQQLKSLHAIL